MFCLICRFNADGQCVVYVDYETGVWYAAFTDYENQYTITVLDEEAAHSCKMNNRGYDCQQLISSNAKGWRAMTSGTNQDGEAVLGGSDGMETEKSAINAAERDYMDRGGMVGRGYYETKTWIVK